MNQARSSWNIDYVTVNVTDSNESHFSTLWQKDEKEKNKRLERHKNGNNRRLLRTENLFIIKFACLKKEAYSLPWQADQLKTADKEQKFLLTD